MALDQQTRDELQQIADRYPHKRSGLLPMLHLVQSVEGRVTAEGIEICAEILDLTTAEVSGVVTFYTMYKRKPVGDHHVGVCTNTLCAIMGGDAIFDRLKSHLDVGNDETTPQSAAGKSITLEHIECNAACDFAPVVMVNWEFMDNQTPESAVQLVDDLRAGNDVHSTRGPLIRSWREGERVLAGFHDDRADEGPSAGPSSLAGLAIAHEKKWTAPADTTPELEGVPDAQQGAGREKAAESADTSRAESETKIEGSPADAKHQDNPDNKGGDAK